MDPQDLNKAIKREHYRIPTPDDIQRRLNGKKFFSMVDMKDGYWHVVLDEESSHLCTFNTPFGRYRFKRMPFGISSASEVFQKRNEQIFGDIEGVEVIVDDMIIAGRDEAEADEVLRKVMQTARENKVKFNPKKLTLRAQEIKYMGNIITPDGLKPDPDKIKSIVEIPKPENKEELRRFLGMVNYLSQFIPNMSQVNAPLRDLLKREIQWVWGSEHDRALQQLKQSLTSQPLLKFFDVNKPVRIQTDASQRGLGACLFQQDHPIAYASRSLTQAEQNYAQIEKELLAIVFACNKFNQYVYGKVVDVQSDHKPLEVILKKPLCKASPRLQRMMMNLQKYQLDVKYVPGKEMYVADTLSRAYLSHTKDDISLNEEMEVMVHTLVESFPATPAKIDELKKATAEDDELQVLKNVVKQGWPVHKYQVHGPAVKYWNIQDEVHEAENLMYVGEKMIIPTSWRGKMLEIIHESHLGIEKCKSRARSVIYWPGMSKDIENMVSKCSTCAKFRRANQKQPMIPHPVPDRAWQKIGTDIFQYNNKDYLLMVDYYSKYPEIGLLKDKTANSVINQMKSTFARHGIPDEVFADNVPFASQRFRQFSNEWGFKVTTSSPTYAQSNGMSERAIQTVKNLLKKAEEDKRDPYIALLEYRNTPVTGMTYSPSQLLMSRMLKSKLPTARELLRPKIATKAKIQLANRQENQRKYYNRRTANLPNIKENDQVRIRHDNVWKPAIVTEKHESPRSFIVTTPEGQSYRRNRQHLLETPISPPRDDNSNQDTAQDENTHQNVRETPIITSPTKHVTMTTQPD